MKIRLNSHKLTDPKIKKALEIMSISDVHSNSIALAKSVDLITTISPDYVCIPGDLLDYVNADHTDLIEQLKTIAKKSKIVISFGNHDTSEYNLGVKREWLITENLEFWYNLAKISGIVLLRRDFATYINDKASYLPEIAKYQVSDDVSFFGLNMPEEWYKPGNEDEIKLRLNQLAQTFSEQEIMDATFNILLSHTPNVFIERNKLKLMKNFQWVNLVLSGHNHAGLTPRSFQKLIKNHNGLVGPYAKIIQPNAFGSWSNEQSSLILSDGVTKVADSSEIRLLSQIANKFYAADLEHIKLMPGDSHTLETNGRKIK